MCQRTAVQACVWHEPIGLSLRAVLWSTDAVTHLVLNDADAEGGIELEIA